MYVKKTFFNTSRNDILFLSFEVPPHAEQIATMAARLRALEADKERITKQAAAKEATILAMKTFILKLVFPWPFWKQER